MADFAWRPRYGAVGEPFEIHSFQRHPCEVQEKNEGGARFPERSRDGIVECAYQYRGGENMRKIAISIAAGAGALLATAVNAAPLPSGISGLPDSNLVNVRLVCNEDGRCWRERGERRVIIRDSYDYAPRERYIERREYYNDEPRAGVGFRAPGVSIGVGVGNDRW
jgi:hypothetical protein